MKTIYQIIIGFVCIVSLSNAQQRYTLFYPYSEKPQDDEAFQWPFHSKGGEGVYSYAAISFPNFAILKNDTEAVKVSQPQSFFIDTLYIALSHENNSGKPDTIIVKITDAGKNGMPGKNILWQEQKIITKGLSKNNDWHSPNTHILYKPEVEIKGGKPFAVTFEYYGDRKDTLGFRAIYRRDTTKAKIKTINGEIYSAFPPKMCGVNWTGKENGKIMESCKDKDKKGNLSPAQHWDFYLRIRTEKKLFK